MNLAYVWLGGGIVGVGWIIGAEMQQWLWQRRWNREHAGCCIPPRRR